MKDIKWERKTVTLDINNRTTEATLTLSISIPEGGCDDFRYSQDPITSVWCFVDDALEVAMDRVDEGMVRNSFKHGQCLSSYLGDTIEDGFVEGQDVTGLDIMFNSLICTEFSYKPHANYRDYTVTETKVWAS